jgi:hypothetical protein
MRVILEPSLTKACLRCGSEILWASSREFCGPQCEQGYQPFEGVWFHRCAACHRYFFADKDGGLGGIPALDDLAYCQFKCVLLSPLAVDLEDWPAEDSPVWATVMYVPPPPMTPSARLAEVRKNLIAGYRKVSGGKIKIAGPPALVAVTPKLRGLLVPGRRQPVPIKRVRLPVGGGPAQSQVSVSSETGTRIHALTTKLSRGEGAVLGALRECPAASVDLWQQRGMPKATVYRALPSLEAKGLIARNEDTLYYYPVSVSNGTETETAADGSRV